MTLAETDRLAETLLDLVRTPSSVPAGETMIEAGAPLLIEAIESTVLPLIAELGPDEIRRHPAGDLAARFGPDSADGLLLMTYLVSQHGDPRESAVTVETEPEGATRVTGPGTLQNKGAMAAAIEAVRRRAPESSRPIWLCVNTEGRSSHGGSRRIIDELGVRASAGVTLIATGGRVSLGNRGRVDVVARVDGASAHASQPWLGDNPIEIAADVVVALRTAPLPKPHPTLGPAAVTPYTFQADPIAPHTIPSRVVIAVDRRLLPGETPREAAEDLRTFLGARFDARVTVVESEHMLPSLVAPDHPIVSAFDRAMGGHHGFYSPNTFDAGYATSVGIPTVMYGPGHRDFGAGLTAAESITLEECADAADVIAAVIEEYCA